MEWKLELLWNATAFEAFLPRMPSRLKPLIFEYNPRDVTNELLSQDKLFRAPQKLHSYTLSLRRMRKEKGDK